MRGPREHALALSLVAISGCGASAATEQGTTGGTEPTSTGVVTDDPTRARIFQAPLDMFVRLLDHSFDEIVQGVRPEEAFPDVVLDEPTQAAGLAARVEAAGGTRVEVGELEMVLVVVKDRGPPESERFERTTTELTAVRAGGVFRVTALHTSLHRGQTAPDEPPVVHEAWAALRDAFVEALSGPDCRFLPMLRETDLTGVYGAEDAERLRREMPARADVDRFCADLWDRSPPNRTLELRSVRLYVVDRERKVKDTLVTTLEARERAIALGPIEE
jgi:hypothetical protein